MTFNKITKIAAVAAIAASSLFTVSAQAGEDIQSLKGWVKHAGGSVNSIMRFPTVGTQTGSGSGLAVFEVTIDRDGDVLNSVQIHRPTDRAINRAAKKVVKAVDFPDLPSSYNAEEMTFILQLSYATSEEQAKRHMKKGFVTSRELASSGVGIRILTAQAD